MAEQTILNVRSNGSGAAFGKKATLDGILESAWPLACPDVALSAGTGIVDTLAGAYGDDVSSLKIRCLNAYGAVICTGSVTTEAVPATAGDYVLAELLDPGFAPASETVLPVWPAASGWCIVAKDNGELALRNVSGAAVAAFTVYLNGMWMCGM